MYIFILLFLTGNRNGLLQWLKLLTLLNSQRYETGTEGVLLLCGNICLYVSCIREVNLHNFVIIAWLLWNLFCETKTSVNTAQVSVPVSEHVVIYNRDKGRKGERTWQSCQLLVVYKNYLTLKIKILFDGLLHGNKTVD